MPELKNTLADSERSALKNLIARNHGPGHVMLRDEMIDYYFKTNDAPGSLSLINYKDDDEVRGILGYIVTELAWGRGNVVSGVWTSHWTVDEAFRVGVGVLLMRRLQELFPVVLGQGANALNKEIVKKMKTLFLDHIPRSLLVLDATRLADVIDGDLPSEYNKLCDVGGALANGSIAKRQYKLTELEYDPDWSKYPNHRFGTLRSLRFLNNKYLLHPVFDYHCYIAGPAHLPSLVIFRVEQAHEADLSAMRVLEFITPAVPNAEEMCALLINTVKQVALKNAVTFIDFYCTNETIQNAFINNGFSRETNPIIPNLLSPLVTKPRDQNLEMYVHKELEIPPWDQMYVTKSDGDQDRPTNYHYADRDR